MELFAAYLIVLNIAGFIFFGIDKAAAKRRGWRIPEDILILTAALGGSLGCLFGMLAFHHKTRHAKFRFGLPLILACWSSLVFFILLR